MQNQRLVCVIDGDEFVRMTICAALNYAGFATVHARDGVLGLTEIERSQPRVAIIDMAMPNKEGLETVANLKRRFPEVKILAISGGAVMWTGDLLSMARELGADDQLAKPFKNVDLIEKITRLSARS